MATTNQKIRHFKDRCEELLRRATLKYENNIRENHEAIANGTVPMMSELRIRQYFAETSHVIIHIETLFDFSQLQVEQANRWQHIRPIIARLQVEKDRAVDRIMMNDKTNIEAELRAFEDLVTKRLTNREKE